MTVRAKLKDLAPGTVFNAGPIDVRVLEHFADGRTLLIADTCIADRHFADQPFKTRPEKPAANPNNWRFSSLNRELNTEFLATFDQAEGPIRSKDILTADWSLADHEGGEGYGTIQAKIALLTQAMYEKYADQDLLKLDDWWWLITPYASNADPARNVNTDGSLLYRSAYGGTVAFGRLSSWNLGSRYPWNLTRLNFPLPPCWPNSLRNSLSKKSFAESPKVRKTVTTMKKTTFKQCAAGDVFEHQGQALIKTTKPNTAVNLNSGAFAHFHDGSLVDRSDLVLIHQADLPSEMPEHLKGGRNNG